MLKKFSPIWAIQRAICSGITQGSDYDCENPLKSGVFEDLIVGNLNDIELVTFDPSNTSVINENW